MLHDEKKALQQQRSNHKLDKLILVRSMTNPILGMLVLILRNLIVQNRRSKKLERLMLISKMKWIV